MTRLTSRQWCPLHRSFFCCGREQKNRERQKKRQSRFQPTHGVRIVVDSFHPRGYREICSRAELKRRKHKMLASGIRACFYCEKDFEDYRQIVVAHKEPKGMGGARHDDHPDNLTLAHKSCNLENGSRRPEAAA